MCASFPVSFRRTTRFRRCDTLALASRSCSERLFKAINHDPRVARIQLTDQSARQLHESSHIIVVHGGWLCRIDDVGSSGPIGSTRPRPEPEYPSADMGLP